MEQVQKEENYNRFKHLHVGNKGKVSQLVSQTPLVLKKANDNRMAFSNANGVVQQKKNTIIQREIKVGTKRKINKDGVTEIISGVVSKGIDTHYAKVTIGGTYEVSVQYIVRQSNSKKGVSIERSPNGDTSIESSIELYNAKEAGKAKLKNIIDSRIERGGFEIDKADVLVQAEGKKDELSHAQGIKLLFHNGQELVIKLNTFKWDKDGLNMAIPSMEHTIPLASVKLWEKGAKSLVGAGNVKLSVEVQPKWAIILSKLGTKFGKQALRPLLASITIDGMIAAGFIGGGVVTLFSAYAAMDDINDIEKAVKNAQKALKNFSSGYINGLGVHHSISKDASVQIFAQGVNMAHTDLNKIIQSIQTNPLFSSYNFTREELMVGILDKLQQYSQRLYSLVRENNKQKIYTSYLLAFYEKKKNESHGMTESKESYAYREAKHVAYRLGLSPSLLLKPSKR